MHSRGAGFGRAGLEGETVADDRSTAASRAAAAFCSAVTCETRVAECAASKHGYSTRAESFGHPSQVAQDAAIGNGYSTRAERPAGTDHPDHHAVVGVVLLRVRPGASDLVRCSAAPKRCSTPVHSSTCRLFSAASHPRSTSGSRPPPASAPRPRPAHPGPAAEPRQKGSERQ